MVGLLDSFSSQLTSASEHLVSYVERSDKPVVGTTYKHLHELVDQLNAAGFFEPSSGSAAQTDDAEVAVESLSQAEAEAADELDSGEKLEPAADSGLQHDGQFSLKNICQLF